GTFGSNTVCPGSVLNVQVLTPYGYSAYAWTVTNGVIEGAADGPGIRVRSTNGNPIAVSVTATTPQGCQKTGTRTINIQTPYPPSITAPSFVCGGSYGGASTDPTLSNYSWSITNGVIDSPTDR